MVNAIVKSIMENCQIPPIGRSPERDSPVAFSALPSATAGTQKLA
ncbi:MAG: hypothetical protein VKK80_02590 [Prochlorothrix sp.]|nr:hypothetical protein [Prochlorothrix sp.]